MDINFLIEIEKGLTYTPLMLAAALGEAECLKIMLTNPSLVLEATDPIAGTNAFW